MTIYELKLKFPNCDERLKGDALEAMLGKALYRVQEDAYGVDSDLREAFTREYTALRERDFFTSLLMWYAHASVEERGVIDNVLWRLTGSTFARIAWMAMNRESVVQMLDQDFHWNP